MKANLRTLLLLLLPMFLNVLPAQAQTKVLYLAHLNKNDASDNPTGAMALTFKSELERMSDGAFRVEIFPEGQLGGDTQAIELVRKGIIQSSISSVGGLSNIYPLIGVLDFPFAFRKIEETYAVLDGPFGQALGGDIKAKTGLEVLGFGDTGGFFVLTNSKRPIRTPGDMKGMRIRTMGVDTHRAFISSLGAEPVGIAWNELYAALKSGAADGQMNPVTIVRFGKLNEVQRHLTLTNHIYTPYVWAANADFMAGLSEDERRWVAAATEKAIAAGRSLNRAVLASDRGLPALKASMSVYEPSEAEIEAFSKLAQPAEAKVIADKLGAEGADWLARFQEAVGKARRAR